MAITFNIIKHRWQGNFAGGVSEKRLNVLTTVMIEPFARAFVDALSGHIKARIMKGNWHRSTNKRYGYYRTWLQYRYGSDRARKKMRGTLRPPDEWHERDYGGKRKNVVRMMQTPGAFEHMPELLRDPVAFRQFQFIADRLLDDKRVKAQAPSSYSSSRFLTPQQREARWTMRGQGSSVDVHEAVEFLRDFFYGSRADRREEGGKGYWAMMAEGRVKEAEELYKEAAFEFAKHDSVYTNWARTTKAGQRLMRQAQQRSLLIGRNIATLQGAATGREGMLKRSAQPDGPHPEAIGTIKNKRQRQRAVAKFKKELSRGGKITAVTAGGFAFGFQTGKLAEAWGAADNVVKRLGTKWKITMSPDEAGDKVERGSLTRMLKRIIERQSKGKSQLATKTAVRESLREAVRECADEWARYGIHTRSRR